MPLPEREPLAGIIHMRATNPRAPHYRETGLVVGVLRERDEQQEMVVLELQFEAHERPIAYEHLELELEIVMP